MEKSDIKLRPHQQSVVDFMTNKGDGMLVAHSMGSGKTITALATARTLISTMRTGINHAYVIVPKSCVKQWESQTQRMGLSYCVTISSHTQFLGPKNAHLRQGLSTSLLVVDEAHKMCTRINNKKRNKAGNLTFSREMISCSQTAKKVLLLTGTPVVNDIGDIINLLIAVKKMEQEEGYELFKDVLRNKRPSLDWINERLGSVFRRRVSFLQFEDDTLPSVKRKVIRLKMNWEYFTWYYEVETCVRQLHPKDPLKEMFFTRIRQAINGREMNGKVEEDSDDDSTDSATDVCPVTNEVVADSEKLRFLTEKAAKWKASGKKFVVYTAWRKYGIKFIEDILQNAGISYEKVVGDMSPDQRRTSVLRFNAGTAMALVITNAGSEGLDLKGARKLVIMDPHFHEGRMKQVEGRVARFGSHTHLPAADQTVTIYRIICLKPDPPPEDSPLLEKFKRGWEDQSADEHLFNIADAKQAWIDGAVVPFLKGVSI